MQRAAPYRRNRPRTRPEARFLLILGLGLVVLVGLFGYDHYAGGRDTLPDRYHEVELRLGGMH